MSKRGFTFVELLIASFFFGLLLISIQSIYQNYHKVEEKILSDRSRDFAQFVVLLEKELQSYQIKDWDSDTLYIHDPVKMSDYQIICKNQKIYKASGHHPYLYNVLAWDLNVNANTLNLAVLMDDQEIYYASIVWDYIVRSEEI